MPKVPCNSAIRARVWKICWARETVQNLLWWIKQYFSIWL